MAAICNTGGVIFGGSSNQVGVFDGQNMQNGWDSHSPNLSVLGTVMGQFDYQVVPITQLNNAMGVGQPIIVQNVKNNGSPVVES